MGLSLKSLLPIAGAAAGYFLGGPAGSAAINAALGSGIGTLVAGGKPEDAIKNAILAGGAGAGLSSLGVGGAGVAQSAGAKAATDAAVSKAAEAAVTETAVKEAAKGGLFGTGLSVGDVALGGSLLGMLGSDEEEETGEGIASLGTGESNPDYKGKPIGNLFVDSRTGLYYDTLEELEEAKRKQTEYDMNEGEGITTLKFGGLIEGPGTGTSDSIPADIYQNGKKVDRAKLSDKEFVFTNKAVTGAGNGDPELGAKRMYAMMDKFERMA